MDYSLQESGSGNEHEIYLGHPAWLQSAWYQPLSKPQASTPLSLELFYLEVQDLVQYYSKCVPLQTTCYWSVSTLIQTLKLVYTAINLVLLNLINRQ